MKTVFIFFLFLYTSTFSQKYSPELQSLIDAENNFAALSKNMNTRDAFLAYSSDSTALFEKGEVVWGKKTWLERKPDSSLLFWWPVFAGISSSGDLGFTTGPWQWSEKKNSKPVAHGYYATVWKKENNSWKMAADIGISFPEDGEERHLSVTHFYPLEQKQANEINKLSDLDTRISSAMIRSNNSLSSRLYHDGAFILRNGHEPYIFSSGFNPAKENSTYSFIQRGSGISENNDLGYTYGTVNISKEGGQKAEKRCYMRVWKKEKDEWKMILDVIGGN